MFSIKKHLLWVVLLISLFGASKIEASTYSQLQYNELLVSSDSQTSPSKVSFIAKSNKVGIGTTNPNSRLTISSTGYPFALAAMSKAFQTVSSTLGSSVGDEVVLTSLGFTSNNNIAFGIRGIRTTAGSAWTSAALGIGMDVDNTARAGASIYLSNSTECVGIGTSIPTYKLQVVGTLKSTSWNVTEVMKNVLATSNTIQGATSFTTYGGTLEIFASGSGYSTSAATLGATIYITDTSYNILYTVGSIYGDCNEASSHKAYIPRTFVTTGVPAGTYRIEFISTNSENLDDRFNCTVTELPY